VVDQPQKLIGRPPGPIPQGPLAELASGLRALKAKATISYATMSARTHYSISILSTAAAGRRLPSWEATKQYVLACGGSPDQWRPVWTKAAEDLAADVVAKARRGAEYRRILDLLTARAIRLQEEQSLVERVAGQSPAQLRIPVADVPPKPLASAPRTPPEGQATSPPRPGWGPRSRAGTVVVSYGGRQWSMSDGEQLTIGRSPSCVVRLPEDDILSRFAARLENQGNLLLIHNISTTKPIALRPPAGEDRVIEPGAAITSLPYRRFRIVFFGWRGDVGIDVDAGGLLPPPGGADVPPGRLDAPDDFSGPIMRPSRLRILAALCRPMLTRSGSAARPATYAEIGQELGLSPGYIRNVVKSIREELTSYGVPGLMNESGESPNDDFRAPLAHWAVRHGWVSEADLE
jgi:hypothetical protein